MGVPSPPISLDNSCSVVHENTLYSFSHEGFVALPLSKGAKWKKLEMGEKVKGASCVGTDPADSAQAALWVVGGQADSPDFTGLQKFTFATNKWTTITPSDLVTKNRQWHSATYIKADDAIVMYGGSQDNTDAPTTQTFTVQASEPYGSRSYSSSNAPPAVSPMILRWSDADAVMLGGDPANNHVFLFNPNAAWRDFGTTLAEPFTKDTASMQAALVDGEDGSKSLYIFDMSQSPNTVSRVVVQDASGAPVYGSAPAVDKSGSDDDSKRDLDADSWPRYNSTLASSDIRKGFAMAQSSDGKIIFSGGSTESPLVIFDANKNSWMNATSLLVEPTQRILEESSTTQATSTSVSSFSTSTVRSITSAVTTAAESTTAIAAPSQSASPNHSFDSNTILGITLGSIGGFLVLLGLLLFCLKKAKRRSGSPGPNQAGDRIKSPSNEKGATISKDEAMAPPGAPTQFRGHNPQLSQESYSSMAILMGRMGPQKPVLERKSSYESNRSSVSSLHKQLKSTISKPIPQPTNNPIMQDDGDQGRALTQTARPRNRPIEDQDGIRRSSGWNRYWSGGSALQILGFGGAKRNTSVSEHSSHYSDSSGPGQNPRVTQDSATVAPLNFKSRPSVSRVNSGSPVVSQHSNKLREGLVGKIERPVSKASSGYSSGVPESVHDSWDPVTVGRPWGSDRAPGSAYASQTHGPPSQPPPNRPLPPSGVSKQPQLAMAAKSSDMSWLNLGDNSRF